eukprot:12880502-Prorocentrum_lima.AAC.1
MLDVALMMCGSSWYDTICTSCRFTSGTSCNTRSRAAVKESCINRMPSHPPLLLVPSFHPPRIFIQCTVGVRH